MPELATRKCVPCGGGIPPIPKEKAAEFMRQLHPDWQIIADGKKIERKFKFKNFREALDFVNQVGELAEAEDHHPSISFGWGFVTIILWTHAISGLFDNDFILAAKIDQLPV